MNLNRCIAAVSVAVLFIETAALAQGKTQTVNDAYPGLTTGALSYATLADLPEGVLARTGSVETVTQGLEAELAKMPEETKKAFQKNAFFLLEQIAARVAVLSAARQQAADAKQDIASKPEKDIINGYVQSVVSQVQVSDEEVAKFYEENKEMCGGAALDEVKGQFKQMVLQEKQQAAFLEHLRTIAQRVPIAVSAAWVKDQAVLARDNPVDKARASGKPTMVDFGADGCRPCEMLKPILANITTKYEGKANIVFVHVRQEQVLAARYNIQVIPVQVFFDKDGKETFRHTGYWPQADIEKKLAEIGAV